MDNQSKISKSKDAGDPNSGTWKDRRKEQLREEFISAAAGLFRASGFDKVSVDDIVSATGVAKGTFYLYFKTKADIVQAVFEMLLDDLERHTSDALAAASSDAPVGLRAVVTVLANFLQENPGMLAPLFDKTEDEIKNRRLAATADIYERIFRMGMLQGRYREIDPQTTSHALLGMLAGLIHRAIDTGESFEEAGNTAVELLERGIGRSL
ncbi:MAG: TetR/AcrR family transcriptional regulator [Armatimonadota bacterium]|nr:TetR/AcrR family transcriptional regulator [bacterium]